MRKLFVIMFLAATAAFSQNAAESRIRDVLSVQVKAWNRGDLPAFVQTYAPNCTFVGTEVIHGRNAVLERYNRRYPSPAAMGHLSFGQINVQQLDQSTAIVYGTWHLDRGPAGGGSIGGVFSLVLRSMDDAWQIVLDHTS